MSYRNTVKPPLGDHLSEVLPKHASLRQNFHDGRKSDVSLHILFSRPFAYAQRRAVEDNTDAPAPTYPCVSNAPPMRRASMIPPKITPATIAAIWPSENFHGFVVDERA